MGALIMAAGTQRRSSFCRHRPPLSRASTVVLSLALGLWAPPLLWCIADSSQQGRSAVARRATPPAAPAPSRTWRQAHAEAKALEEQLTSIVRRAEGQAQKMDTIFEGENLVGLPKIPPVPKRAPMSEAEEFGGRARPSAKKKDKDGNVQVDTWDDLFTGELSKEFFSRPSHARDFKQDPPIMTFQAALKGQLSGIFSRTPEFQLPPRVYPVQLTAGAGDDPSAGEEENRLWKESMELTIENLERLWPQAEAALGGLANAEVRAEARSPAPLVGWNKRVREVMRLAFAHPTADGQVDLEKSLNQLQTEKRLLGHAAQLEDLVLEVEGCNNELAERRREAQKFRKESDDYRRKMRKCTSLEERVVAALMYVRTISTTAIEMEEMDIFFDEVSNFASKLNPFGR